MITIDDAYKLFLISLSFFTICCMTVMIGSSSCAGRDVCGNKYCLTGIIEKYLIIPYIMMKIGFVVTIATGLLLLYKYLGL